MTSRMPPADSVLAAADVAPAYAPDSALDIAPSSDVPSAPSAGSSALRKFAVCRQG